jgi:two-component system response regulator YesN
MEKILNRLVDHVQVFARPADVIEHLKEDSDYNVLITDLMMPVMTGWQLLTNIQGKYPHMKSILLTGGDLGNSEKGKKDLADYILNKPISLSALREFLAKHMNSFK